MIFTIDYGNLYIFWISKEMTCARSLYRGININNLYGQNFNTI